MLKLTDGRNHLYQWDTGRKAEVTLQCDEVHFFNISRGTAISIKVTDGVVSIPDELLRSGEDLRYWAFVGTVESGYTMKGGRIEVVKRPKPSDYVYTETEVVTIETAVKNALEKAKESGDFPECDVTSVNGQTGDVQTRLLVTITENEDGTYTSSHTSQEVYAASQAGAVIEGANFNGRRYQTYICSEQVVQFLTIGVSGGSGKRSLNTYVFLINGDKVIQSTTQTPIPVATAPMVGATASAEGTAGLVPKPAAGDQGKYLKGDGTWANIDCVRNPDTAAVGQTIVVKSVDENGKPAEWEATPLGLRKIIDYTTEEETANETVGYVEFFTDIDGNPISMKNCLLKFCGTLVNETDNDYHLRMDFLSKYTGTWYEFKPTAKNQDFAFCLMVSIDEQGRLSFIEGGNKRLSDISSHGITAIDKISIYTNHMGKTHIAAGAHIQVWEVM